VNAKRFYLLLYSIALRTLLLSPPSNYKVSTIYRVPYTIIYCTLVSKTVLHTQETTSPGFFDFYRDMKIQLVPSGCIKVYLKFNAGDSVPLPLPLFFPPYPINKTNRDCWCPVLHRYDIMLLSKSFLLQGHISSNLIHAYFFQIGSKLINKVG